MGQQAMGNYEILINKIFDESESTFLREDAIAELARLKDPRCLAGLLRACTLKNKGLRFKAIEMLSQWDHHAAFGDLLSALADDDDETRRLVIKALGLLGARILTDAVEKGTSDESWAVRRTVEDIIKGLSEKWREHAETTLKGAAFEANPPCARETESTEPTVEPKRWMLSPESTLPCESQSASSAPSDEPRSNEIARSEEASESAEHSLLALSPSDDVFERIAGQRWREDADMSGSVGYHPSAEIKGPCAIVRVTREEINIPTVGRLIAKAKGVPLYDVTREINISKGFLAKDLDADVAREAALQLIRMGIPVSIIEMKDLVTLCEPAKVVGLFISSDRLVCDCRSSDWTTSERIERPWDEVALITSGRLETRRQRIITVEEDEEREGAAKPKWWSSRIDRKPQEKLVVEVAHKFLIDIFFREPAVGGKSGERVRIGDDVTLEGADASIELLHQEAPVDVFWAAKELSAFSDRVPISDGVKLLAQRRGDGGWADLTFVTKKDFDAYNSWLLQLVKMRGTSTETGQSSPK